MSHPLNNPFRSRSTPSKTEAEVIGDFLGEEAREEFEKVSGPAARIEDVDFEITDEEREEMRRMKREADEGALERNGKWTKKRYIIWAESFDEDEKWVDAHFKFQPDGTTITPGGIDLHSKGLTELPKGWVRVESYCDLSRNQLTSLAGAPKSVGGSFWCSNNQLTSLAGAPESVGVSFSCNNNQLTSLVGAPENVGSDFYCFNNQLTSLDDLPENIRGRIYAKNNPLTPEAIERAKKRWEGKLYL